jgi:prepilin-type processing-associated H-X9-DG protein
MTLVELIVTIGLIGALIGLLMPAVQKVRDASARSSCLNNLRQVGIALHNYHAQHGQFPTGGTPDPKSPHFSSVTWMVQILPHVDQRVLWERTQQALVTHPLDPLANPPHVGLATVVKVYLCPVDGRLTTALTGRDLIAQAYTSFIGVSGSGRTGGGVLGIVPGTRTSDVMDGTSSTLMVGERPPPATLQAGSWYSRIAPVNGAWGWLYGPSEDMPVNSYPTPGDPCVGPLEFGPGRVDNPCDRHHHWSLHAGGANFTFADGSVRFIGYNARPLIPALATRAGGEVVSVPE